MPNRKQGPQEPPPTISSAPSDITGIEVTLARKRLDWTIPELAHLFGVSLSTISRWEAVKGDVVPADANGKNLLRALIDVLDRVPDARERLTRARAEGPMRQQYMLLGMFYNDTPWNNEIHRMTE